MVVFGFMALSVVLLFARMTYPDPKSDEQAVWQLEESYWEYVKNNDIENYRNLWDDQFVGWPRFSESPLGKEKIVDWIAPLHKNPDEVFDYELTRKAVRSFGDIVVVHYLVRAFMRSKDKMVEIKTMATTRITHTWRRTGKTWQIITGMSGLQPTK